MARGSVVLHVWYEMREIVSVFQNLESLHDNDLNLVGASQPLWPAAFNL
jgi:hypothetical protein